MTNDLPETRRHFYVSAINALGALIAAGLGVPALLYLFVSPVNEEKSQWVSVANLASLTPEMPQEVSYERNRRDGWKVTNEKVTAWLVKTSADKVVAFSPWCTHLGCAYHWDNANHQFLCPCHGSTFSVTGQVTGGPAPRPLDRMAVKIEGNEIQVGPQKITNA